MACGACSKSRKASGAVKARKRSSTSSATNTRAKEYSAALKARKRQITK